MKNLLLTPPCISVVFAGVIFLAQPLMARATSVALQNLQKDPGNTQLCREALLDLVREGNREAALNVLANECVKSPKKSDLPISELRKTIASQFIFEKSTQAFQESMVLWWEGRRRAAQDKVSRALELESNNLEVLTRHGQMNLLENNIENSLIALKKAHLLLPEEPVVRAWYAKALIQMGEKAVGLAEMKEALKTIPSESITHEWIVIWIAEHLASIGQRAQGLQYLEKFCKANPEKLSALTVMIKHKLAIQSFKDPSKEKVALWALRKELQLGLSRFNEYVQWTQLANSNALEIWPGDVDSIRTELNGMLQRVDSRIQLQNAGS